MGALISWESPPSPRNGAPLPGSYPTQLPAQRDAWARPVSLEAITLAIMMVVVAWIPAANIYITLTVCKPGTVPNAAYTIIAHGPAQPVQQTPLFAHFTDGMPTA